MKILLTVLETLCLSSTPSPLYLALCMFFSLSDPVYALSSFINDTEPCHKHSFLCTCFNIVLKGNEYKSAPSERSILSLSLLPSWLLSFFSFAPLDEPWYKINVVNEWMSLHKNVHSINMTQLKCDCFKIKYQDLSPDKMYK